MAAHSTKTSIEKPIGHNRSMEDRRAEIEEIITQQMLHAQDAEMLSLQQIRDLADVQRLGGFPNNHRVSAIMACREHPLQDKHLAVLHIVYAMGELRQRAGILSANQIAQVLNRKERSIPNVLSRLVSDGYIIKGAPAGRHGVVPHYLTIRESRCNGKVNPLWIMSGIANTSGQRQSSKIDHRCDGAPANLNDDILAR